MNMTRSLLTAGLAGSILLAGSAAAAPPEAPAPAEAEAPLVGLMGPGLYSSDLDASIAFFRDGLGLTLVGRFSPGSTLEEAILSFGTGMTPPFIILARPNNAASPEPAGHVRRGDRIVLRVSDADAVRQRLVTAGFEAGEITVHSSSDTRIFWTSDPDGHHLEITQPSGVTGLKRENGHG